MADLSVQILTPAQVVKKTTARQVQVPGIEGELGILPGHTAFVTELGQGILEIIGSDNAKYKVTGGYLEVINDEVTVLADKVEST